MSQSVEMDKKINEALEKVRVQREEVEKAEKLFKKSWITNTAFKIGNEQTVNIKMASVDKIVVYQAYLLEKAHFHDLALEALSLAKTEDFKYDGFTVEEWNKDFVTRLNDIELKAKKDKLKDAESRLKKIMSEDQKRQNEFDDILGSL